MKPKLIKKHQQGSQLQTIASIQPDLGLQRISDIPIPTYSQQWQPISQFTSPQSVYPQPPQTYTVQTNPTVQTSQQSAFSGNIPVPIQKVLAKASEGKFYSPGRGKYLELGNNKYKHLCTSGPASFYKDALGIKLNGLWWDTGSPKTAHKTNITKAGFTEKWAGDGADVRNGNWKSAVRPGDIMVLFSSNSAHAEMWDGTKWISDTNQNKAWCYGKDNGRFGKRSAILYRNDKLWA